jgi:Ras-related protein Rab-8A
MATVRAGEEHFDTQIKVLTLGNSGVGKTCLILRFAGRGFSPTWISTIGIDVQTRYLDLSGPHGTSRVKMMMWDTAGQEAFRSITASYFRSTHGVLLVYDVTSRASFQGLQSWIHDLNEADRSIVKVLVASKCDATESQRAVTKAEGEALAKSTGAPFFETSAKKGTGVDDAFTCLAQLAVANALKQRASAGLHVAASESAGSGCAC